MFSLKTTPFYGALWLALGGAAACLPAELGADDPVDRSAGDAGGQLFRVTVDGASTKSTDTSDTGTPTTDTGTEHEDEDGMSQGELAACGQLFDGATDFVHVTGNQQYVELSPADILAVKVTGNLNEVLVTVEAAHKAPGKTTTTTGTTTTTTGTTTTTTTGTTPTTTTTGTTTTTKAVDFDGICFILRGNQAIATASVVDVSMGTFALHATGNRPHATLDLGAYASVDDIVVSMRGNQGSLLITGKGSYDCPKGDLNGNGPSITCK